VKRALLLLGVCVPVATFAVLAGMRLYPSSSSGIGLASTSADMNCSVKTACDVGEVAMLRMSSPANAHAQTADTHPLTYDYTVCCAGPAGLSTSCSGSYATVLRLWAADNAHAAQSSDTSYTTEVCLSATGTAMNCQYGSTCGSGYACLATISGTTNAHVADCDGSGDYPAKVCCAVGAPPGVGGIAELPDIAGASTEEAGAPAEGSGWSAGNAAALAGAAAAAAGLIAVGGWYVRRRWVR